MKSFVKHKDESWDFRSSPTKEYTHCFHNYPAMMIPQVARRLLERYGRPGGWLLDPYCGTGTSLVEASLFGMNAVGCDINPLARLIARAKVDTTRLSNLDERLDALSETLFCYGMNGGLPDASAPPVLNKEYWFSDNVSRWLATLRREIDAETDPVVCRFLRVAFSETVRECSYTKNSEFKLVRMAEDKMTGFKPDAASTFLDKLVRNRAGLGDYMEHRRNVEVRVVDCNTANKNLPEDRKFDLVITSPPYGDSPTTVAYGQFSRLSAQWIGLPDDKVDRLSMGGIPKKGALDVCPVTSALHRIRAIDRKRARQVESFYIDLANSARTVAEAMRDGAIVCYVVGNRTVKGVTLATDEFVANAFERHGFQHIETIVRNIPNKRMPARNSPSNVAGRTAATMREECVVVCQKID